MNQHGPPTGVARLSKISSSWQQRCTQWWCQPAPHLRKKGRPALLTLPATNVRHACFRFESHWRACRSALEICLGIERGSTCLERIRFLIVMSHFLESFRSSCLVECFWSHFTHQGWIGVGVHWIRFNCCLGSSQLRFKWSFS